MRAKLCLLIPSFCIVLTLTASAGPLTEARVTKIINDVRVVAPGVRAHPALMDEVIKNEVGLKTGIKSRSELLFSDNTLTRIGPETYFSFKAGTREMALPQGTMLLQVPKGLGGAKIRTAAVTASITGTTIMIEHTPGKILKVLVLEGSLRLSVNGTFGDSLLLTPGRMVIMRPDAKRIPDPVAVDLAHIVRTSSLVKMGKKGSALLPSIDLVNQEIDMQQHEEARANLIPTNLVIQGRGASVTLASDVLVRAIDQRSHGSDDPLHPQGSGGAPTATPPTSGPTPAATATPQPSPAATPNDGENHPEGNRHGSKLDFGTDKEPAGDVTLNSPIDLSEKGKAGQVNVTATGTVAVNTTIKVSESVGAKPSHSGGKIAIESRKTVGTAISISSSAQLLALLKDASPGAGGSIKFESAGGAINMSGTARADHGLVDIRNNGSSGVVNLTNATLHGDVVKVGALGSNGTLNVGGGTIDADSTILLYAGGSNGTVNFTNNVTLSGNSLKTIAGDAVTIFNGKVVTVNGTGPASVFTNNPNYAGFGGNGSTTGTFGGQGATTQTLSALPTGF